MDYDTLLEMFTEKYKGDKRPYIYYMQGLILKELEKNIDALLRDEPTLHVLEMEAYKNDEIVTFYADNKQIIFKPYEDGIAVMKEDFYNRDGDYTICILPYDGDRALQFLESTEEKPRTFELNADTKYIMSKIL